MLHVAIIMNECEINKVIEILEETRGTADFVKIDRFFYALKAKRNYLKEIKEKTGYSVPLL